METKKITRVSLSLFFFFLSLNLVLGGVPVSPNRTTVTFDIGVILDLDTLEGKKASTSISIALSDFYITHSNYKTRLVLHTRDSKQNVVGAASAALYLVKNVEVQAIIGPITSAQANFVVDLGNKSQVPIVSFSATSPSLSFARTPYFVRTTLNDSSQVRAIAAIVEAFGWKSVVPVYEDTDYGNDLLPYLNDALQEIDAQIPYMSVVPLLATGDQILKELAKLMTMQTRVFIMHMSPSLASRLFLKAAELGMMSIEYSWIITDGLSNLLSSMNSSVIGSMQGVLGIRPYFPKSKELDHFKVIWRRKYLQENLNIETANPSVFDLWAYDTVWALAMAAEKVGRKDSDFLKPKTSDIPSNLGALGVSQIGPKLIKAVLESKFKGLSGEFILVDGQLQSLAFEILNVAGNGGREIGFWTPASGISRRLKVSSTNRYSTSKANLGNITWPGESSIAPKGWVIPKNGTLRVGVPVIKGFGSELVAVNRNTTTNLISVTGYCIDVFKAVMEKLPYSISYEFVPFQNVSGSIAGNYNDLIYQVFLQNYDAVVGDITIIANRSLYVDFALPFTESGVSMVVPVKGDERKNAWIFLKPLTMELWFATGAFVVFIGFVVWILEHRVNDEFRGAPSHHLGMIFWFSFLTLVFALREKVVSNLARFVVIIWIFVVLIITSSYTANLTSMLTAQRLQPTVTNVKDLLQNREYVGCQKGSFVVELLKSLNFEESFIRFYDSPQDFDKGFSLGSKNGGFAAAFDEIPYIDLILARKYCAKYTKVGPSYRTGGFGFAFQKGSMLVPDISRAVLNVTEGLNFSKMKEKWFGNQTSCPDLITTDSSTSLTLDSFWGLFVIAGVSSLSALLIFVALFYYDHRDIWRQINPENSLWQKIVIMGRHFDTKVDNEAPGTPNVEVTSNEASPNNNAPNVEATSIEASPNNNAPESSPSNSSHTGGNFSPLEDQHTLADQIS
ncbi:hypothetical protein GIB67_018626 [Kingdonia uniflora]|uniref:Glutamate receptor n=1 Tax=Kingdonia uniflora TaxID=39325 RepID=A0A7J7M2N4_9MAGN|nr:hypothetical protein GIB67_018626 [Kingdonia uniflora]